MKDYIDEIALDGVLRYSINRCFFLFYERPEQAVVNNQHIAVILVKILWITGVMDPMMGWGV